VNCFVAAYGVCRWVETEAGADEVEADDAGSMEDLGQQFRATP
jgi:hypothetical protein